MYFYSTLKQVVMKKTLLFTLLSFTTLTFSQAPAVEWKKCYGGIGNELPNSILQTTDGGYIVAGESGSGDGDVIGVHSFNVADFWVVKLSATGVIQWQKCYGGSGSDIAYSIQQTTDGGYIVAGSTTSSDGDVTGFIPDPFNPLWPDYWVVKISSTGVLQWQKTLGAVNPSLDIAKSIIQTNDGGFILCGQFGAYSGNFANGSIVKLSATGSIEWNAYGDSYDNSIIQTTDGGYLTIGGLYSYRFQKTDSTGMVQWTKFYGGTGFNIGQSIVQTPDGGYIAVGTTNTNDGDVTGNHGSTDVWIVKVDSQGNLEWQKCYGGTGGEAGYSIKPTADGSYIIAAETGSSDGDVTNVNPILLSSGNFWMFKINSIGTLVWQKTMGGNNGDVAASMQQTADGGYIVAGKVLSNSINNGDLTGAGYHVNTSNPNGSGYDIFVVKFAPDALDTSAFENESISLYPNPINSILNLNLVNNETIDKVTITNILGKAVLEQSQNTTQINLEDLASGLYIVQVFSTKNKYIKMVIKQ